MGRSRPAPRAGTPAHERRGRRRVTLTCALVLVTLGMYAGRLVEIQAIDASALASTALKNRMVGNDLPAVRGDILDRDGAVLATTARSVTVTADPTLVAQFTDPADPRRAGPRAAAALLSPVLGIDATTLTTSLSGDSQYAVVARDVPPEVWRTVAAMRILGIFPVSATVRDYPSDRVGANVVGFVGSEATGLAGIEFAHDADLTGVDGWVQFERSGDSRYREIPGGAAAQQDPVDGDDVSLTLDRDLQWQAEQGVARAVATSGAQNASVVAIDVATGEVLAMAVAPGYNPNDVADTAADRLGNVAVEEVFEPGSTSKVITIAAAMEDGLATPTTPLTVPDRIERAGRRFNDSHSHPTQQLTVTGVLAESSNTGTILASDAMSSQRLHEWFDAFGFGRTTGIGLPGESAGLLTPAHEWSGAQRYTVVFGQGVSVTALQMASVFQTIANDGVRVPPRVVRGRTTDAGRWIPDPVPSPERVLSPETSIKMQRMLESVVNEGGTGNAAAVAGYRVAGKTGTAQRYDQKCGGYCGYTASFVGFAPAEDPQVVVAVTVQDPVRGIYGGTTAAPVFRDVMQAALAEVGATPSTVAADLYPLTW